MALSKTTSTPIKKGLSINSLYLDPNNYRFIDQADYRKVEKSDLFDDRIQKRTHTFIVGEKRKGIEDLIKSFTASGFLPVDLIQVEKGLSGKFRVLEGNRRVATLKELHDDFQAGKDIGNLDSKIFSNLPVIEYQEGNQGEHEMIMGLKHILGNKPWPTLNQAQLLYDLINKYQWTDTRVCDSFGLTRHKLNRDLRTIALTDHFKQSDFGDQFKTDFFSLFREIVSSTPIKSWLSWDESEYIPTNLGNTDRLYSWLVDTEEEIDINDPELGLYLKEKIIVKSSDVRDIAKFITDENAIRKMEETRSIIEAYQTSDYVGVDKFNNSLEMIDKQLGEASQFSRYANEQSKKKLKELRQRLDGVIVAKGFSDIIVNLDQKRERLVACRNSQFTSIQLVEYKGFKNQEIRNFNRINIFAGNNNSGKSSLLEALYLLVSQNDINAFFETQRRRGKFIDHIPSTWIDREFRSPILLQATFDDKQTEVKIWKEQELSSNLEKSEYLSSIFIESKFNGEAQSSKAQLFQRKDSEQYYDQIRVICGATFSTPFAMMSKKDLIYFHEKSVEEGTLEKLIQFIQTHIDAGIRKIERVGDGDLARFLVHHQHFDKPVDLSQFGEGLQRIFYISLQIVAAQKGVMLIDELENAIYYKLLKDFSLFLQELAEEFNVQLFITTHSNECIRAFFENGTNNESISAYRLNQTENGISCKYVEGAKLFRMMKNFKTDLRG